MKLLIIISVIACSYAEKLDNTYLPPESAATAGGSPGSLTVPGSQSGPGLSNAPSTFGQPSSFGQPTGNTYGQGPSQTGLQSGSAQPGQISTGQFTPQQYNQGGVLPQAGRPGSVGVNQPGSSPVAGRPGYGQGTVGLNQAGRLPVGSGPGFGQGATGYNQVPSFGGQAQGPSAYSGPAQPERARASIDRNAEILRYDNQNNGDSYAYSYETSNGISAEESGVATNGVRAQGSFAYTGDDGQQYSVTYTADENGFVPRGDHLPTPPPIPEEILKSLEDNARAAAAGTQEGAYNPNEDSGVYADQGQPGQAALGYRPGQGSSVAGAGQQRFQNQGASQYGSGSLGYPGAQAGLGSSPNTQYSGSRAPVSSSTGSQGGQNLSPQYGSPTSSPYQGASAVGNQSPTSQYNTPGSSPFGSAGLTRPGFSSQGSTNQSPASGMSGQQGLNQNSGYQYNTPGSLSGPGRFGQQGSQVSIGQNPAAQYNQPGSQGVSVQGRPNTASQYGTPSGSSGSYRPGSQTPIGGAGLGSSRPSFTSQDSQNLGYNYNAPTGSSSTGPSGSGGQSYPSQGNQSPISPFGTGPLNRPQGFSPGTSQIPSSQNIPSSQVIKGTQGSQLPGGQSPSAQYGGSVSPSVRPSGSQSFPSQGNQASKYDAPSLTAGQIQPGLNQRPQLGTASISGPTGSTFQRPTGEGQDDGYQYNRPQNQFGPSQTGSVISRPSGTSAGSSPYNQLNDPSQSATARPVQNSTPAFVGNNFAPSGLSGTGPTTAPNVFGASKPTGNTEQGYPSGPTSGSTGAAPVIIGQGSNALRPGQYSPGAPTSGATGPTAGSAPYQYNRPGSQGPSSANAQRPFTYQPGTGSSGQDQAGQVGSQPSFGSSAQDRPNQTGSPSGFGPSSQDRPGQTGSQLVFRPSGQDFGGPRQPPSFSPEEGYKY